MLPRSTAPFNQIHAVSQSLQEICETKAQQSLIKANKQNYFVILYISLGNQIRGGKWGINLCLEKVSLRSRLGSNLKIFPDLVNLDFFPGSNLKISY